MVAGGGCGELESVAVTQIPQVQTIPLTKSSCPTTWRGRRLGVAGEGLVEFKTVRMCWVGSKSWLAEQEGCPESGQDKGCVRSGQLGVLGQGAWGHPGCWQLGADVTPRRQIEPGTWSPVLSGCPGGHRNPTRSGSPWRRLPVRWLSLGHPLGSRSCVLWLLCTHAGFVSEQPLAVSQPSLANSSQEDRTAVCRVSAPP